MCITQSQQSLDTQACAETVAKTSRVAHSNLAIGIDVEFMLTQVPYVVGIVDRIHAVHVSQKREHAALHIHVAVHFHAHADGPERFWALPPPYSEQIGTGIGKGPVIVLEVAVEAVAGKVVSIILVLDDVHHILKAQRV